MSTTMRWCALWMLGAGAAWAGPAEVTLPAAEYDALRALERGGASPAAATLASARVTVSVPKVHEEAEILARVEVHVVGRGWSMVPLLPAGVSLRSATRGGETLPLVERHGRLWWLTEDRGRHTVELRYVARSRAEGTGGEVEIPVPAAARLTLSGQVPGEGVSVRVAAARLVSSSSAGGVTRFEATGGGSAFVSLSWRAPGDLPWFVSAADYAGEVGDDSTRWVARFRVRVQGEAPAEVPLLPAGVALESATLNGKPAEMAVRGDFREMSLRAGVHTVEVRYATAVVRDVGPPSTALWMPTPARAAVRLELPGEKVVSAEPAIAVRHTRRDGGTVAQVSLPATDSVTLRWSEALSGPAENELRAHAELFHVVRADEGVLHVQATVALEITRGRTHTLRFSLPSGALVNAVRSEGLADWRVSEDEGAQTLSLHFDRELSGAWRVELGWERLLTEPGAAVEVPLARALDVHRQRGLVALVDGAELRLVPTPGAGVASVGVDALPEWLRRSADAAHAFKHLTADASLTVRLTPAPPEAARFEAQVDTLFSISPGVLRAAAAVSVRVKSGKPMALRLALPPGVSVLAVTAPALRSHTVEEDGRALRLAFTRELTGTTRVEVAYERVLSPDATTLEVPALHVEGAEPEQGRLAVEAVGAVEVWPRVVERLAPMDVRALPKRLSLQTTHPILHAWQYVHAEAPFELTLELERHDELALRAATIEHAAYETAVSRDGVHLTRATYRVHNRHRQFLSLRLPAGAELWTAQLDGAPVKPAKGQGPDEVLVPLRNADEPFDVELVFRTRGEPVGLAGTVEVTLPRPDVVENRTTWDVFLPEGLEYDAPASRMRVVSEIPELPLGPSVIPRTGAHIRLTRLLGDPEAAGSVRVRYAGWSAHRGGAALLALAGLLLVLALPFAPLAPARWRGGVAVVGAAALAAGLVTTAAPAWVLAGVGVAIPLAWVRRGAARGR
jgi:hypothetical protein